MLLALNEHGVRVWCIVSDDLQTFSDMSTGYKDLLSVDELVRANKMRVEKHRLIYIVAKMLVRKVLSQYCQAAPYSLQFHQNPFGKPHLLDNTGRPSELKFNLSHCGNAIMLAVSRESEIGADVELDEPSLSRDVDGISKRFFTEIEQSYLEKSTVPQIDFLKLWTLKEAYIKYIGKGLSMPLNSIEFLLHPLDGSDEINATDIVKEQQFFHWASGSGNRFSLCLATLHSNENLTVYKMDQNWQCSTLDVQLEKISARHTVVTSGRKNQ